MPGVDDIDITSDLNGQAADAVPSQGNDLAQNQPAQVQAPADKGAEKPRSLRDTLSDAFKGESAPKADEGTEKPSEPPAAPSPDAPELVKVGERYHRRDGSFASRDEIDAFTRGQAPAGEAPSVTLPQWANTLTDLEKQQFSSLPAEIRQYVERTMEGVNTRGAQLSDYGMIEQVLGPRRQAWAQEGMTPAVAINQLFALSDFAGRDPSQFVMWFADQHKLDLDALLDARDKAINSPPDPHIAGLQQEIAQLRNTISGFTDTNLHQVQAKNFQLVQEFMDEKDEAGNVRRPYFNELADAIASHVQMIKQQQPFLPERDILQAAYDFAAYSNPIIRDRMQQETTKAVRDKAVAEAARARNVGVSVSGGPAADGAKSLNGANRTLRETLVAAYNDSVAE